MSAIRPTIQHLDPGYRATCGGCGEYLETTRYGIATDWKDAHVCSLAAIRARRLHTTGGGAA